ncbi:MAG: hypothetical protein ACYS1A_18070 [Planctomycetota bacterium]|jgi:hypothetical protein
MLPIVYAPKEPGQLLIRGYGPISVWSWDDGFLYDEVTITTSGAGAIAAGTEGVFFRDIATKNFRQTNMSLSSQLPSGWEMIVLRIGIHVQGDPGLRDTAANVALSVATVQAILGYGYVEFILDNSAVMASGPATRFPIFGGVGGHMDIESSSRANFAEMNNGSPVFNAVAPMQIPIIISDARTFRATIHFYEAITGCLVSTAIKVAMVLHGFVKKPAM